MNKMFKDAFILCLITLTAGALLAGVYEITKEPIRVQQELAQQKACQEVFNNAISFEENNAAIDSIQKEIYDQGYTMEIINKILLAKDENDTLLGYVFEIIEKEGYGGDISFMIGIQCDGTLNGISILSINETAGLGMNATDEAFKSQFKNKNVESFVYTKNRASSEEEIDAISGATVTTNAMVNGVNAGIKAFQAMYKEGE